MTEKQTTATTRLLDFFSRLPMLFLRAFARVLASLVNALHISQTSKTIRRNIEICFPDLSDQERERISRAAIHNELQSYMEFFNIWGSSNAKNIARIRHITGEHYVHQALAENKGLVLIVPHFGTWEVMNAWFAQHTQMTIMYKPIKNPDADQFVRQARSRERANLVPTDESGVRQIFKALKQGGTTVILPDHTPKQGGEMIEYFGVPLASSNLTAKLIQKTKARALLLYAIRNQDDSFNMFIEPMDEAIYSGSANDGTLVIHHRIEQLIQRFPEHYHWSYKRFKANPALQCIYNDSSDEAIARVKEIHQQQAHAAQHMQQADETTV
ncbi:lysophospholipid acyltransferase family protein [Acinetobacter larvae]|uniref:Lipid A biosynthesis acyltransferase n=1 Tax=Acinetobacter larvae TaxID=1789224 RepID=A0A1B2LY36_9GAMM|nr:lysophospholipid acyltransferase family protein [Acinetobacter larvae]AOA57846.1 lipid A biosynthesis acyltransferase [Acinetobacter larvae]